MDILEEAFKNYRPARRTNVVRNEKAYADCFSFTSDELERLVEVYRTTVFEDDMRARLLRDSIDHHIRRYQKYSIQGKFKSHYYQRGISLTSAETIFEHIIPEAQIRDSLIEGKITINQALNSPTCRISRDSNKLLNARGMHDQNTDPWRFFKRYTVGLAGGKDPIEFETYNGQIINDLDNWTFRDHYDFFGIKD